MDVLQLVNIVFLGGLVAILAVTTFLIVLFTGDADLSSRFASDPGPNDYRGKVVLVTGASSGIGEALARRYALAGASGLVLAARDRTRLLAAGKVAAEAAKQAAKAGGRTWAGLADDSFGLPPADSADVVADEDASDAAAAKRWQRGATGDVRRSPPTLDVLCVVSDVTDAAHRDRLVARVAARFGRGAPESVAAEPEEDKQTGGHRGPVRAREARAPLVDVLVTNAGRSQRALAEETDPGQTRAMLDLNFLSAVELQLPFYRDMLRCGGGSLLVTSSLAGKVGSACAATYSASKFAVQGYMNALRAEGQFRGVRVTLGCPGPVATAITRNAMLGQPGARVSQQQESADSTARMTADRCAQLMVRAERHGLQEAWMSPQPLLLFAYLAVYLPPAASAFLASSLYGPKRVRAMLDGDMGYGKVQSLAGVLCAKPEAQEGGVGVGFNPQAEAGTGGASGQ